MSRPYTLTQLQNCILERLGDLQFATPAQFERLCEVRQPAISKAVAVLLKEGLIDGYLHSRPAIFHLTPVGGRLLIKPLPEGKKRNASWSVMSHACHLNEVQSLMNQSHNGFRFLSRDELYKQGLNPAFGEHGAVDGEGKSWFVLLDDYLMTSDRITRSWTRRHTPNTKHWPDPTGRAWRDVVQRFLVVCADEQHAARHRTWILKNSLPAEVIQLTPLWKT